METERCASTGESWEELEMVKASSMQMDCDVESVVLACGDEDS